MIETICNSLTKKIIESVDEVDESKADEINYGLQLLIGEVPKFFITLILAILLNIVDLTLLSFLFVLPYRSFSGGFHLHTHLGCIIATNALYIGTAYLGSVINISDNVRYGIIAYLFIFCFYIINKYAPADTENVPVLQKKERKKRKICSFAIVIIELVIAIFIPYKVISNIILIGLFLQTCTLTKLAYRITKNKYGYEIYGSN